MYSTTTVFVLNHLYISIASFMLSINMIYMASRLLPDKFITLQRLEISDFQAQVLSNA